MEGRKAEVFLSYCWEDEKIVDEVYNNLIKCTHINLHRDKLEIKQWGSIKEYMQSIPQMDYVILFISKAYLESENCMYEVLEVMRDRKYKDKIFPAVIYTDIYKSSTKVSFVKYWQNELSKIKEEIKGVEVQNLGKLGNKVKEYQNIASDIADFLEIVSDMNNPNIKNISEAIKNKLPKTGIIEKDNIYIFIKHDKEEGFNIDLESGTEIDFEDWYNKLKSGGKIVINNKYINEIEKFIQENKKTMSEEKRKKLHDAKKSIIRYGEIMELMIQKALFEDIISDKIRSFSDFVKATFYICFEYSKYYSNTSEKKSHILQVYYGSKSFKFNISDDEYVNILKESEDRIRIPHFVFFDEFMNWVTDKSILDKEIIPVYLKINAIRELDNGEEIPVEDFSHWWISIG